MKIALATTRLRRRGPPPGNNRGICQTPPFPTCRKTRRIGGVDRIGRSMVIPCYTFNVFFANTREIFTLSHEKVACSDMAERILPGNGVKK
jgi:hypothetical protein